MTLAAVARALHAPRGRRLHPFGVLWCGWLVVLYAGLCAAAASAPGLWGTGDEALAAYRIALDVAPAAVWAVVWAFAAGLAAVAAATRRLEPARAALALSVLAQGVWTLSVGHRIIEHGFAYVPATLVWATPLVVSGIVLAVGLVDPADRFTAARVDTELLEELRERVHGGPTGAGRAA